MRLVLLHSPLTGSSDMAAVAPLLEAQGHDICVPDYRYALAGPPPYYEKIARAVAGQISEAATLIVHSGAGALVPSLIHAAGDRITTVTFVDAVLPHLRKCWFDTVSEPVAARVRGLAIEGRLPPWDRWWPLQVMESLLPDAALRGVFLAGLPSLPLAYLEECAPDISLPRTLPCAYLQLSSGYDAEACEAQRRGWPLQRLSVSHLAMLTHPHDVADALETLISDL